MSEAEVKLDELFTEAFGTNHPAMLDWVRIKFELAQLKADNERLKNADKFVQGYMCALAVIVRSHGENTPVHDAFACQGTTESKLRMLGVDESDIEALKPIVKEFERKQNANKAEEAK